jgi:hypothetical protein
MTATHGGLSTSVIALIAVGGVAGLLALLVITAWAFALPKRYRQRKSTVIIEEEKEHNSVGMI